MPKLRQLTKHVIRKCYRCKRFQVVASPAPAVGDLPHDRKSGSRQFQVIGVDFAGPLIYIKMETRRKSLHRCVKLQFNTSRIHGRHERSKPGRIPDQLQRFISRRGRPENVYSDNFSTFVAAFQLFLEGYVDNAKDCDLKKRAKYIRSVRIVYGHAGQRST